MIRKKVTTTIMPCIVFGSLLGLTGCLSENTKVNVSKYGSGVTELSTSIMRFTNRTQELEKESNILKLAAGECQSNSRECLTRNISSDKYQYLFSTLNSIGEYGKSLSTLVDHKRLDKIDEANLEPIR